MDRKNPFKRSTPNGEFRRRTDIERTNLDVMAGEAELRIAIEATGLGIIDYYPLSGELYWSHTAKEHFGLSPDAHVNYNVFLVGLHPEDRERVDRLMHGALQRENDGKYSTEYRTIGIEDGKERRIAARGRAFFNQRGEAVRFIGTTLDISDQKRAEEALRESREHYRLLFDKSPLPKWVIDLETFVFLEVNEAAVEHYGYSREEFAKLTLADVRTSAEFEKFEQWVKEPRPAGEKFEAFLRTRHRKKNNEIIDVEIQYTEIAYNGRKAMLVVILDLTGRGKRYGDNEQDDASYW